MNVTALPPVHADGTLMTAAGDGFWPAQLAALLARLDPAGSDVLQPFLLRLQAALAAGHVCLGPLTAAERQQLAAVSLVGAPGSFRPLLLDRGRLYFARQWLDETVLADNLLRMAADPQPLMASHETKSALLEQLFGVQEGVDWQRLAARLACDRRFLTISGGPGTGKTTTVVRLLAMLASLSERPLVMAMAAPTGKAAARLSESVRMAQQRLPVREGVRQQLPQQAQTLHRLLGLVPGTAMPRHHAANPLPLDVLVVDEASMIDLGLMAQTVAALPAHARLILLGDRDQLASVDAGAVLADICRQQYWRSSTVTRLRQQGYGDDLPVDDDCPLADSVVMLEKSHRFGADSGIGQLARAVNHGDGVLALSVLQQGRSDLALQGNLPSASALFDQRAEYWRLLDDAADPARLFRAFEQFMLLAAERHVVQEMNTAIGRELERRGRKQAERDWYAGRPVMISSNDYTVGLFNGDIGLTVWRDGQLRVLFPQGDGGWRFVSPARLPEHDTVFAMTVHKSQGSEFDEVALILPAGSGAVLGRALLYTAITRARQRFVMYGAEEAMQAAIANAPVRYSGLAERLWMRP